MSRPAGFALVVILALQVLALFGCSSGRSGGLGNIHINIVRHYGATGAQRDGGSDRAQ